jgi:hypothetical protein
LFIFLTFFYFLFLKDEVLPERGKGGPAGGQLVLCDGFVLFLFLLYFGWFNCFFGMHM